MFSSLSNIGFSSNARSFPGFPQKCQTLQHRLAPRDCQRYDLGVEDIVSLAPMGIGQSLQILVFDDHGHQAPELLGLVADHAVDQGQFDNQELRGWIAGNGGDCDQPLNAASVYCEEFIAFGVRASCTIWLIRPQALWDLIGAPSTGLIDVAIKSASSSNNMLLPPPLGSMGSVREEFTVKRGTAQAYVLAPDEFVQIIDVAGQQCSDFMAMRLEPLECGHEFEISTTTTRSMVRGAYPSPGLLDKFYDQDMRPMLRIVQDTCGRHDTFGVACTARSYQERGFPGHLNCSDNISVAFDPYGIKKRSAWPAINFFWNTWVDDKSHHLLTEESYSRPGDYVAMQAMEPLVCVTTACPDDIDPINGWNPTDVHVRIYHPDAPIRCAIAYREKEDAPMSISRESPFHPATSKLTSQFAPARDLWAPLTFPAIGTIGEYWACREKATLQDMSSLRKYDIIGPDAARLLQYVMSRDIARVSVWRGTYALICDKIGNVVDDGTLFRLADDLFRWCCGNEESARIFESVAAAKNLQVRIHGMGGALPNLALQGPKSRDVLSKIVFTQPTVPSLQDLKWFGVTVARMKDREGIPFMLSRSGYTGELGYELFCASSDAPALWDSVMAAGEELGITPMGSQALEIIRIEAGLASRAEFASGGDAVESGLGFAISSAKSDFIGKAALVRSAGEPRRVLKGLKFCCNDVPASGAHVYAQERPVGVITSAVRSPMFECSIAMARLAIEFSESGKTLEVGLMDGAMKRVKATVCDIPFVDPKREKPRA